MRRGREPWRLDSKSKFALWMIVLGVQFQCVLLLGLAMGWWK